MIEAKVSQLLDETRLALVADKTPVKQFLVQQTIKCQIRLVAHRQPASQLSQQQQQQRTQNVPRDPRLAQQQLNRAVQATPKRVFQSVVAALINRQR
jgi:hypothetical protein